MIQQQEHDVMEESGGQKRKKRLWVFMPAMILIFIILLLAVAVSWKSKKIQAEKQAALSSGDQRVNTVILDLKPRAISDRINLPGVIEPWIKIKLKSEVSARVIKKKIEKGITVKKGDVIVVLDNHKYKNEYLSAKALYESSRSTLKRVQGLQKEDLATAAQLENAVAQAEKYKADMGNSAHDLDNCVIRAPDSGVVNNLFVEEGEYINISTDIADILQMDRVKVIVGIPESDVNDIRHMDEFDVIIDALNGAVFKGKKHFLSKSADSMARVYNLEIAIDNQDGDILPDMFARVDIVKKTIHDAIVVPLYSLISYNKGHIVYIEQDGTARMKKVSIGIQEGDFIQIVAGLIPGDRLIVRGHRNVSDGQPVSVVRTVNRLEDLAE